MLNQATHTHAGARRPGRTVVGVALVALLLGGVFASCTYTPQAVHNVPFSYTFGPQQVWLNNEPALGAAGGTVALCVDSSTQLSVVAGPWSEFFFELEFDGSVQHSGNWPRFVPWVTSPVGPGCGTLHVQPYSMHFGIPDSIDITVTKA